MARGIVVLVWVQLTFLPMPVPAAASGAVPRVEPVAVVSHAVAAAPFDCNDLWASGFPDEGTGLSYCLEHSRETIGGAEYRVVYPSAWATAAGLGTPYLDAST